MWVQTQDGGNEGYHYILYYRLCEAGAQSSCALGLPSDCFVLLFAPSSLRHTSHILSTGVNPKSTMPLYNTCLALAYNANLAVAKPSSWPATHKAS